MTDLYATQIDEREVVQSKQHQRLNQNINSDFPLL